MILKLVLTWLLLPIISLTYCATTSSNVVFTYGSSAVLTCDTDNDESGVTFYKVSNSSGSTSTISSGDKFSISSNVLTIKDMKKEEVLSVYSCKDTSGNIVNFVNQVAPYLYKVDSSTIFSTEGFSASFGCYLLLGDTTGITWTWTCTGSCPSLSSNSRVSITSTSNSSIITISDTVSSDDGNYVCKVTNSYGSHTRTTSLKIKSSLAPVWPFLGFVAECGILAVIISGSYLFKRMKKKQKPDMTELNRLQQYKAE